MLRPGSSDVAGQADIRYLGALSVRSESVALGLPLWGEGPGRGES